MQFAFTSIDRTEKNAADKIEMNIVVYSIDEGIVLLDIIVYQNLTITPFRRLTIIVWALGIQKITEIYLSTFSIQTDRRVYAAIWRLNSMFKPN